MEPATDLLHHIPLPVLTGNDAATMLALYHLDQHNPKTMFAGSPYFDDYVILASLVALGYVPQHRPISEQELRVFREGFAAIMGGTKKKLGPCGVIMRPVVDLEAVIVASLNNLVEFKLAKRAVGKGESFDQNLRWRLPEGRVIRGQITVCVVPGSTAHTFATDTLISQDSGTIYWRGDAGRQLPSHRYSITSDGRTAARVLLQGPAQVDQERRSGGRGPVHDVVRDQKIAEAWSASGARSYKHGADLLANRFPGIKAGEIRAAVDRNRHRRP